ncbi:MAG: hypothetical protein IJ934_04750 [Acetobacter sp.]|nr:hypothetical protein [Acetobacter sp.]
MLVQKYRESQGQAKEEMRLTIQKAVSANPELRSKKELIDSFLAQVNAHENVMHDWNDFVAEKREKELNELIKAENLKPKETRKYFDMIFRDGEVKMLALLLIKSSQQ